MFFFVVVFTWADVSWRGGRHSAGPCCAGTALRKMRSGPGCPWTGGFLHITARPGLHRHPPGPCGTLWLCYPWLQAFKRLSKGTCGRGPSTCRAYASPPSAPSPPLTTGDSLEQHGSLFFCPGKKKKKRKWGRLIRGKVWWKKGAGERITMSQGRDGSR